MVSRRSRPSIVARGRPAASLPKRAAQNGATLILVNLAETPLDSRADRVFREDVTDVLPALRDTVVE